MTKKKERKDVLKGWTQRIKGGCGNVYAIINEDVVDGEKQLVECFLRLGKTGGCAAAHTEAEGRLISLALKYGCPLEEIVDQLTGISCHKSYLEVKSCPDGVAQILRKLKEIIEKEKKLEEVKEETKKKEEEKK